MVAAERIPPPRLHILFAKYADVAVIFRRGPSKRTLVFRWDTAQDTIEPGAWFRGRLYERRSDLSPDGELLLYFAANHSRSSSENAEYTYAWTAVSRPPQLTALALWPKGDCWHGGGLFTGARRLILNHRPDRAVQHPKHREVSLEVGPDPEASGEDDPLFGRRLTRDGWELEQEWRVEYRGMPEYYATIAPEIRRRRPPRSHDGPSVVLTRRIDGLHYSESFRLEGADAGPLPAGPIDWLDWDQSGRLVLLQAGRMLVARREKGGIGPFQQLADFSEFQPPSERAAT